MGYGHQVGFHFKRRPGGGHADTLSSKAIWLRMPARADIERQIV